jgi:hypothetical protein
MIPYKLNQLDQGLWSEQCRVRVLSRVRGRHRRDRKVCPVPGQGEEEAILTAQHNPGVLLAPEDAADVSLLPAGCHLLSQDRGLCSLKCNIRCDLFWG